MRRYEKPFLAVAQFTTRETIANGAYTRKPSTQETYEGDTYVVTNYDIESFGLSSAINTRVE